MKALTPSIILGLQVVDLQMALKEEHIIVEEKKATTQALIESIGKEKAVADEAVDASRTDEEAAAALQVSILPSHAEHISTYILQSCITFETKRSQDDTLPSIWRHVSCVTSKKCGETTLL